MEKEENEKPKCEKCGSRFTYIRIKDNQLVCRSCGHIQNLEFKKEEN